VGAVGKSEGGRLVASRANVAPPREVNYEGDGNRIGGYGSGLRGETSGSLQVQAISAEPSTFTAYRTFGFRLAGEPPFPYQVSARAFEVERRMHDLVATALARKGYREAGTSPDFWVRLSSGTVKGDTSLPYDGVVMDGTDSFILGEMVVDAFDGSTAQQVWHGTAQAEIDPHAINERAIGAAVQQMLAPFPARSDARSDARVESRLHSEDLGVVER
jgi:uncharacterized protein DUF4136